MLIPLAGHRGSFVASILHQSRLIRLVPILLAASVLWAGTARSLEVGQILVADRGANAVIEIDPVTGDQSVIASGAPFLALSGLTFDRFRRVIYVTDHGGPGQAAGVYRVVPETGVVTPVALGGNFVQPGSLVVESTQQSLIVAEGIPGRLIRVNLVSGDQSIVASPPAASGLLFAGSSNYYVSKTSGIAIEQINLNDPASPVTVGAGGSFSSPTDIGGPIAGLHYAAENSGGFLIEINLLGYNPMFPDANQTIVAASNIVTPFGVIRENAESVVLTDPGAVGGAGAVIRYTPGTGIDEIVTSGDLLSDPRGVDVVPTQTGWVLRPDVVLTNPTTATVSRWNQDANVLETIFSGAPLVEPTGVAVDPVDGTILVADSDAGPAGSGVIFELDQAGGISTLTDGGFLVDPVDLELEPDGDVVIADPGAAAVLHVARDSGVQTSLGSLNGASAVTVRMDGTIYAAGTSPIQIVRFPGGAGPPEVVAADGNLTGPTGLVLDPEGLLVVLDASGLVRVDPDAYSPIDALANQTPITDGGVPTQPAAIDIDVSSNYILADPAGNGASGALVAVSRNGGGSLREVDGTLGNVTGVAMMRLLPSPDDILVTPLNLRRVVRVDPDNGSQTVVSSEGFFDRLTGIAIRDERTAFVTDSDADQLLLVDLGTGQQRVLGTASSVGLNSSDSLLQDVEIGPDGTAWVVDEQDGNRLDPDFQGRLYRVDPVTLAFSLEITDPLLGGARGFTIDDAGELWIATSISGIGVNVDKLLRYDPSGTDGVVQVASGSPLLAPGDVSFMPSGPFSGALFVPDGTNLHQASRDDFSVTVIDTGGFMTNQTDSAVDNQLNIITVGRASPHNIVRHRLIEPPQGAAGTPTSVEQDLISRGLFISTMAGVDVMPAPEPGFGSSWMAGGLLLTLLRRRRVRGAASAGGKRRLRF